MALVNGPIFKVAWVVDDLQGAERWFTETFGVPAWTRWNLVHCGPEHCTYRGQKADFVVDVSIGYAGDQQLELIEPKQGASIYTEHLERCGPGLHHIAFVPDDFETTLAEAVARGITVTQQGAFEGGIEFAYLDGSPGGAPNIELMKVAPAMRDYFDSLRASSAKLAAARGA